ncbi:TMV resistance protein N-like isoform X2 [Malus sylvestris]|uniref:TMV resistance protein N-like isoform X2 n=1 Tax=Malus sylvestris TaxID=3752 RepID=UPI0021ACB5C4|nr:TMV resistance protein N-like isoform X2 [Malus sylvestris]
MALSTPRASASFVSNESSPRWKYDVFLSFRGVDTRKGFVSHLYHELCKCQGITTFFDDRELEGGTSIHLELPSAIKESHIAIVVLSPNYASSKWCLNELTTILQCMEARNSVLPVFYETDPSDVGNQRRSFAKAFDEHEEKFISTEDKMKVTQWREALKKVSKISGWHSKESKCERELIEKIVHSVWRKLQATFTLLDSSQKFVGVNFRLEQLSSLLAHDANDVRFIGITGMGGIAKYFIGMHDLIQEMAWTIVGQESKEPGLRSRLWLPNDIFHIFTTNTGTRAIEGIVLQLPVIEEVHWSCEAFSSMDGLRFLEFDNLIISSSPKFLPCSLRIMVWSYYPSKSLPPSFHPRFLTELRMHHSKLVRLWDGKENFPKLKCIDLSYSNKLIRTPDFNGLQNLEVLILRWCKNLVEIHSSFAVLKKLKVLNLRGCESIKSLPSEVQMDALEFLNLSRCSKVKKIPEFSNQMKSLSKLFVRGTTIEKLPIEHLVGLTKLSICKCKREPFVNKKNLKFLRLSGQLAKPSDDWDLLRLVLSSLYHLRCLKVLRLRYCDLGEGDIPNDIGCLSSLKELDLCGNNFVTLPASIKCLSRLENLWLDGCERLEQLPDLPSNSKLRVYLFDCTSLKRLSDPSNLFDFAFYSMNCITLVEDENWIKTIYSRIVKYATEKIYRFYDHIVCPGKGIPEWFNNQTLGHALDVELPPQSCSSWMGIAFCVVFAQPKENLRLLQKQKENWGNLADLEIDGFMIRCLPRTNREQNTWSTWYFRRPLVSEHLWIFYLPRKQCLQEQFLFETYYRLGMNKPKVGLNMVKKCGARLVYKQDLKELKRTLKILK